MNLVTARNGDFIVVRVVKDVPELVEPLFRAPAKHWKPPISAYVTAQPFGSLPAINYFPRCRTDYSDTSQPKKKPQCTLRNDAYATFQSVGLEP